MDGAVECYRSSEVTSRCVRQEDSVVGNQHFIDVTMTTVLAWRVGWCRVPAAPDGDAVSPPCRAVL